MEHSRWGPQRFKRFCPPLQCSGGGLNPCTRFRSPASGRSCHRANCDVPFALQEAQVAQKGDEMIPALSPVNTLEHITEHTTFANFLCENTQNTWNTYFCEKGWGKGQVPNDPRGASPGIIYENTCSMCSMCSCPPTNDRNLRSGDIVNREKMIIHFSVRPAESKRAVNPLAPAGATLFWVP